MFFARPPCFPPAQMIFASPPWGPGLWYSALEFQAGVEREHALLCPPTRLLAMPKSQAREDPKLGSKLCRRRKAVAKVSAAKSSANAAPTRQAMKRWTTTKLTSKQCSKSTKAIMGVRSGAIASCSLGPLTPIDCHSGGNLLHTGAKNLDTTLRSPWWRWPGLDPSQQPRWSNRNRGGNGQHTWNRWGQCCGRIRLPIWGSATRSRSCPAQRRSLDEVEAIWVAVVGV